MTNISTGVIIILYGTGSIRIIHIALIPQGSTPFFYLQSKIRLPQLQDNLYTFIYHAIAPQGDGDRRTVTGGR